MFYVYIVSQGWENGTKEEKRFVVIEYTSMYVRMLTSCILCTDLLARYFYKWVVVRNQGTPKEVDIKPQRVPQKKDIRIPEIPAEVAKCSLNKSQYSVVLYTWYELHFILLAWSQDANCKIYINADHYSWSGMLTKIVFDKPLVVNIYVLIIYRITLVGWMNNYSQVRQ